MITVEKLRFTYPGGSHEALAGMDFSVEKGEIFGFLGPSGAGKSTAQKVLTGVLRGYQGSVHVLGKEVRAHRRDFYQRIGVAMETPNLYGKFSALENLRYFASLYRGPCEDPMMLLESLDLSGDAGTRVSGFSRGMKVRLNFLRAIQHQPELIFLDEPTAGLDPARARLLRDRVLELKAAGRTVLLTTHNMHLAQALCDRVAFIVDGAIRLIDTPLSLQLRAGDRQVRYTWREDGLQTAQVNLLQLGRDERFLALLKQRKLETLHTLEPSLEDLFIEVTGRSLT